MVAQSLNLDVEVSNQELSQWKIKYFANLITNQEMLRQQNKEEYLEIFNHLLKSVFENRFNDFISNPNQKDEIGCDIAYHNQQVEKAFKEKNINWDNWLNFKEQVLITVDTQKKQDTEALFKQFEERLKNWITIVSESEPRLKTSLEKDLTQLNQKKKEFDPSKINIHDSNWLEQLLPTYTKSLNYLKTKYPDFQLPIEAQEAFAHLIEAIKAFSSEHKEKTVKKQFIVKLWDRDPRKDMFQGNDTDCCIAVGVKESPPGGGPPTLYPETIFQYLIDKGINVAEIIDPDTGDVIAQTWLFVTLDNNGKPVLIADNFEVNRKYPQGDNINNAIREAMFEFLNRYAQACNISKVGLGMDAYNDIETQDLQEIENLLVNSKLGGYLYDDGYYLEALLSGKAFNITREVEGKKQEGGEYKVEVVKKINKELLEKILLVEQASFPEEMQSDLADLKETLENRNGIQIIAKNEKGEVVSYLSSKPLKDAFKELKDYDLELKPEEDALYIESIATKPEERNIKIFLRILKSLQEEAKRRGYKKITMHARVENGLSEFLQKKGAKKLRRIENWHNFGEPFDYLEVEI
jgi:ribosomal protein S18 acetylase RimI-like enzyme